MAFPETGLVSFWKFDGNSVDSVGANNGTDTAITYSAGNGKVNSGAGFARASSSKIVMAHNNLYDFGTGDFTESIWMKSADTDKTNYWLVSECDLAASGNGIDILTQITTGTARVWVGGVVKVGTVNIMDAAWHNIIISRASGVVSQYIDNVFDVSATQAGSVTVANSRINFGFANGVYSNLALDACGIWNRALTSDDRTAIYNGGAGSQPGSQSLVPLLMNQYRQRRA